MSKIIDTNEDKDLLSDLKILGLSTKESRIYLALVALGETGASALVSKTGLHRQFVYDTLTSLEEKGLIGHLVVRGRKRFYNHGVSKLSAMFEQKKRVADEIVTHLEKTMMPADIQAPEIYRGQEAFVSNEFEIIKKAQPGSKMYIFGGIGDDYEKHMGKYLHEYEYRRVKKNIDCLYLGSTAQRDTTALRMENRELFQCRFLPSSFSGNLNITVYEDSICFYIYGTTITNFTVRSKRIAKSYADFFMGLWEMSR